MQLKKSPFIIIIGLYLLVVLINLARVPIAWTDEIMLIDPAYNFWKTGSFSSMIWPHLGTESVFLAYLPLSSFIHLADISIFPHDLFYTRILWPVFLAISAIYLFKLIDTKYHSLPAGILVLIVIYLFDEGISNAMRSGRVEMPELALIAAGFYLAYSKKQAFLQALLISLLLIAHPSVYPIAFILAIELLFRKSGFGQKGLQVLIIASFPLLYLAMADFDLQAVYQQLVVHGKEHDGHDVSGNALYLHFIKRFLPVYKFQPYMLVLNMLIHLLCVYNIIVKRSFRQTMLEWAFLLTSIFWLISLAPFYRYSPVLVLLMFMLVPDLYRRILSFAGFLRFSVRKARWWQMALLFVVIGFVSLPFIVRNTTAFLQYKERDSKAVYTWLDQQLKQVPGEKVLFVDEAVAYYYSMNREHVSYTLPYSISKFRFADFDRIYYLTHRTEPAGLHLQAIYMQDDTSSFAGYMPQKILTYKGMKLFLITNEAEFNSLQRGY